MQSIKDKVVVITGASAGIGKAIALKLAEAGAKAVLGARNKEQLHEVCQLIKSKGGTATSLTTDVKKKEDLINLVSHAVEQFGHIDVLVSNAGIARLSRIDELDIEGWEDMIDINLKGVLYGMAAVMPFFKKQNAGHIINIISTSGLKIVPTQGVYAGTKNAVRTIAEAFRQESDGNIRITGISPGYINTEFAVKAVDTNEMKAAAANTVAQMAISPDAIADAVIYAISQPKDVEVGDIVIRPSRQN